MPNSFKVANRPILFESARRFFLFAAVAISLGFSFSCHFLGLPVVRRGPALSISEVTKSLANSWSFTPPFFAEIYRDAKDLSTANSSRVWQDVFALDKEGRLRPKHSIFSAIVAVPFFIIFGNAGFWIMQQLLLIWLLYSTFSIVAELTGKALPWSTLLATLFMSQTIFYTYGFSYDLHACSLIIGGLHLKRRSPVAGGVIMALALFVRPSLILLITPLLLARNRTDRITETLKSALGVFLVILINGALNYYWWGSPFLTSYHRLPAFYKGMMVLSAHPIGFDLEVLYSDIISKLFSPQGLLPYNLSFITLPWVLIYTWRQKDPFRLLCLLSAFIYTLYIFSYPMWNSTSHGNRFLFPAIYLYLLSFIPWLGRWENSTN
jgi:hypothetical protein